MPASSSDTVGHIEEALTGSLKGGSSSSIDDQLLSSAKRILLSSIEFKPAEKQLTFQLDNLRTKYINLNPGSKKELQQTESPRDVKGGTMTTVQEGGEGLPTPRVVLYPPEKVEMEWKQMRKVGSGLINMGNTCFLNSTLQCLTYTPPLANYLLGNEHTAACKQAGFCMLCELQRHIRRCYEHSGQALRPQCILQKLKLIAKHMHWGRQEDAHEFLRYVVEAAQKSCLNGHSKLDKYSKETTVVNQIFGGYLRSQVICQRCKAKSNTYDPFLDISLDIKNAGSLEKAFEKFVQPETLDSENAYNCPRCKHKVSAQKNFTIHKPPNTLTVQLKRFDYNRCYGGKVTRHIHFPEKLNLRPYMSIKQGPSVMYQLYAVLVHCGGSCNSGHYYSYIRAPNGMWHCMNDSMVQQASLNRVLSAEAYLLFYRRYVPNNAQLKEKNAAYMGNVNVNKMSSQSELLHKKPATSGNPSNEIGLPVSRKPTVPSATITGQVKSSSVIGPQKPATVTGHMKPSTFTSHQGKPSTILPASQRDKISFGIKPPSQQKSSEPSKPRIVMHIKNGKVNITEKPAVMSPTSTSLEVQNRRLVPYNAGDSSSESDSDSETATKVKSAGMNVNGEDSKKSAAKPGLSTAATASSESVSPTKLAIKLGKQSSDGAVVMDKKLNATTSVPGSILSPRNKTLTTAEFSTPAEFKDTMKSPSSTTRTVSPVKRILNDGHLTCVTSATPRINSTSAKWHVLQTDAQVSPSIASESSNTSTNSTTEWHVSGSAESSKGSVTVPDAQCAGWTVTPDKHNVNSNKNMSKVLLNGLKKILSHSAQESKSEESTLGSFKESTNVKRRSKDDMEVDYGVTESKVVKPLKKPVSTLTKEDSLEENNDEKVPSEKLRQSKSNTSDVKDETQTEAVSSLTRNKEKSSLVSDSKLSSTSLSSAADHPKHSATESTSRPDNTSRTEEDDCSPERRSHKKKHKKHKKHKKQHREHHHEGEGDAPRSDTTHDSSAVDSPVKKHKKKKHKRHKEREEEDERLAPHTDAEKKSRKRHSSSESESTESKRPHRDVKYEWVERTKDNISHPKEEKLSSHEHKEKEKREVPTQYWDQHVKDGYKRPHSEQQLKLKIRQHWDGSRNTASHSVVQQLQSSARGYGAAVSSWEGGRSSLDTEVSRDRAHERKRHWSDDYEEELDRGKVKKLNRRHSDHVFGNPHNPFQGLQEWRSAEKERHKMGGYAADRDRHHYHHKSYHRH